MTALSARRHGRWPPAQGFVLAEVLVALVLAAVVIGSLTTSTLRATGMAARARADAAEIAARDYGDNDAGDWGWGPMVEAAVWGAGPELTLRVRACPEAKCLVGAWVDGWSLGDSVVESGVELRMPASAWVGQSGGELVLRVREHGGPWGPPWRSVVPGVFGRPAGKAAEVPAQSVVPEGAHGEGRVVVHLRSHSNPLLTTSWSALPAEEVVLGLVHVLREAGAGWCEVDLDTRVQWWYGRAGRALDVYF